MVCGLIGAAALVIVALASGLSVVERQAAVDLSMARQQETGRHASWQKEAPTARVEVNRANEEQLQTVSGIGPATARRILDGRKEHGPFERLEDLLNIRGVGVPTLGKLRPYVTVDARGDSGA